MYRSKEDIQTYRWCIVLAENFFIGVSNINASYVSKGGKQGIATAFACLNVYTILGKGSRMEAFIFVTVW